MAGNEELWWYVVARKASLVWDDRQLVNALGSFNARYEKQLFGLTRIYATRATAYARKNAIWTDRTGNARNGLSSRGEKDGRVYRVTVFHGVPYGIWLEVKFSGRYAILRPTVDALGPQFLHDAGKLFSLASGGRN